MSSFHALDDDDFRLVDTELVEDERCASCDAPANGGETPSGVLLCDHCLGEYEDRARGWMG